MAVYKSQAQLDRRYATLRFQVVGSTVGVTVMLLLLGVGGWRAIAAGEGEAARPEARPPVEVVADADGTATAEGELSGAGDEAVYVVAAPAGLVNVRVALSDVSVAATLLVEDARFQVRSGVADGFVQHPGDGPVTVRVRMTSDGTSPYRLSVRVPSR